MHGLGLDLVPEVRPQFPSKLRETSYICEYPFDVTETIHTGTLIF